MDVRRNVAHFIFFFRRIFSAEVVTTNIKCILGLHKIYAVLDIGPRLIN